MSCPQFGTVYLANFAKGNETEVTCAVKKLRTSSSLEDSVRFLSFVGLPLCMYVCMCVCVCVFVCLCIYIYVCVCIHDNLIYPPVNIFGQILTCRIPSFSRQRPWLCCSIPIWSRPPRPPPPLLVLMVDHFRSSTRFPFLCGDTCIHTHTHTHTGAVAWSGSGAGALARHSGANAIWRPQEGATDMQAARCRSIQG